MGDFTLNLPCQIASISWQSTILRQGKCSILYQSFDGSRTSTLR
nr:MAG TPA: hypothetical protein [Caudoviricetes sp.]